jgi:hypothetical protein
MASPVCLQFRDFPARSSFESGVQQVPAHASFNAASRDSSSLQEKRIFRHYSQLKFTSCCVYLGTVAIEALAKAVLEPHAMDDETL